MPGSIPHAAQRQPKAVCVAAKWMGIDPFCAAVPGGAFIGDSLQNRIFMHKIMDGCACDTGLSKGAFRQQMDHQVLDIVGISDRKSVV